jgi:hypothetical protein
MRLKSLLLVLSLTLLAAIAGTFAQADETTACPICTTYENGSQCCVSCICDASGQRIACTNHFCPPAGGSGSD